MPNKDTIYQTIDDFLRTPFGSREVDVKRTDFEKKYQELKNGKKIYCENYAEDDGMYLMHIKVPSESHAGIFYDVVIQLFTDDKEIERQLNLSKYYVQFFSNSPSFMYKYAALYKVHGYLIDSLYEKLDQEYSNMLPDKQNPDYKMNFDKSLYMACRFLQDHRETILRKSGLVFYRKVSISKLLKTIKDFETVKADSELYSLERSLKKEHEKDKADAKEKRKEIIDKIDPLSRLQSKQPKKKAKNDTLLNQDDKSIHVLKKKKSGTSTVNTKDSSGKTMRSVRVIKKKKATTSTKKK